MAPQPVVGVAVRADARGHSCKAVTQLKSSIRRYINSPYKFTIFRPLAGQQWHLILLTIRRRTYGHRPKACCKVFTTDWVEDVEPSLEVDTQFAQFIIVILPNSFNRFICYLLWLENNFPRLWHREHFRDRRICVHQLLPQGARLHLQYSNH